MHTILALDASSTKIGFCLWNGSDALAHGTIDLGDKEHLTKRIQIAALAVGDLIRRHQPSVIALENAVYSFPSAIIAQQRVAGGILLTIANAGLLEKEISPSEAKKALTGSGKANKAKMIKHAQLYLGNDITEHAADAMGIALAAWPLVKVEDEVLV